MRNSMPSHVHTCICLHTKPFLPCLKKFLIQDFKFNINQLSTLQQIVHSYKREWHTENYKNANPMVSVQMACFIFLEKKINFHSGTSARHTTKVGPNQPRETSPGQHRDTPFPPKEEPPSPDAVWQTFTWEDSLVSLPQVVEGPTRPPKHHELDRDLGLLREYGWGESHPAKQLCR